MPIRVVKGEGQANTLLRQRLHAYEKPGGFLSVVLAGARLKEESLANTNGEGLANALV